MKNTGLLFWGRSSSLLLCSCLVWRWAFWEIVVFWNVVSPEIHRSLRTSSLHRRLCLLDLSGSKNITVVPLSCRSFLLLDLQTLEVRDIYFLYSMPFNTSDTQRICNARQEIGLGKIRILSKSKILKNNNSLLPSLVVCDLQLFPIFSNLT